MAKDQATKLTLKGRISDLVDSYDLQEKNQIEELKKGIFGLVQKSLYPDQFCPECDDRLFPKENTQECLNCGFSREIEVIQPSVKQEKEKVVTPEASPKQKRGEVPKEVEEIIKKTESSVRSAAPGAKGDRIRQLASQIGDVGVPPTPMDTERLKGSDPNVRDVNWV